MPIFKLVHLLLVPSPQLHDHRADVLRELVTLLVGIPPLKVFVLSFLDLNQCGDLSFKIIQKRGKKLVQVLYLVVQHDLESPWQRFCCTEGD